MNQAKIDFSSLVLGGGAAASVIVPQAITRAMPQLLGSIAPLAANALPYCTGVCGNCGGTCAASIGAMTFLTLVAKFKLQRRISP